MEKQTAKKVKNNKPRKQVVNEALDNIIGEKKSAYKLVVAMKSLLIVMMSLQIIILIANIIQFSELIVNIKEIAENSNIKFDLIYCIDYLREQNGVGVDFAISVMNAFIGVAFFFLELVGFLICNRYTTNFLHNEYESFYKD